jgi:hypothetical protein
LYYYDSCRVTPNLKLSGNSNLTLSGNSKFMARAKLLQLN